VSDTRIARRELFLVGRAVRGRRHVGGASGAAVKPWKSGRAGRQPLHTMYVDRKHRVASKQIPKLAEPSLRRLKW
jgi:hypothetical protein